MTITGGKLTTWRRMAKQMVDRIVEREGREAPCHTAEIPLGMEARLEAWRRRRVSGRRRSPSSPSATATPRGQFSSRLEGPEAGGADRRRSPDLLAEAAIAARREQARAVADVLLRRTRLGSWRRRSSATPRRRPVADAMGAELGWSRRKVKSEAEAWPAAAAEAGIDQAA